MNKSKTIVFAIFLSLLSGNLLFSMQQQPSHNSSLTQSTPHHYVPTHLMTHSNTAEAGHNAINSVVVTAIIVGAVKSGTVGAAFAGCTIQ